MHNKKGFTLIELLVVISIIALLMSVLLPALNKVKQMGKITVCKSNLKQLAVGLWVYSGSMNDKLPEVYYASNYDALLGSHYTWPMYVLRNQYDPSQAEDLEYWGFGKLWEYDILEEPDIYYCPSLKGDRNYHSFYNPKDSAQDVIDPVSNEENSNHLRAFYSYSPLKSYAEKKNGEIIRWPLAKKTSEIGSNTILSCDRLERYRDLTHKKGSGENAIAQLNMVFGDGSVKTYTNPEILNSERASNLSNKWFFEVADDAMN